MKDECKCEFGHKQPLCEWQKIIIALVVQASGEAADRRRLLLPRLCLSLSCCQCLIESPAVRSPAVNDIVAVIGDKKLSVILMPLPKASVLVSSLASVAVSA